MKLPGLYSIIISTPLMNILFHSAHKMCLTADMLLFTHILENISVLLSITWIVSLWRPPKTRTNQRNHIPWFSKSETQFLMLEEKEDRIIDFFFFFFPNYKWNGTEIYSATLTKLFLSLIFLSLIFFKTTKITINLQQRHGLISCSYCSVFHLEWRIVVGPSCLWLRDTRPNGLRITHKLLLLQHEIHWH